MLKEGRSAVRSSLHREARTRDRFGPAGARTPHVTAADLGSNEDSDIDEWKRENLQHMLTFLFVDLCDPAKLVIPTGGFQELPRVIHDPGLTQLVR